MPRALPRSRDEGALEPRCLPGAEQAPDVQIEEKIYGRLEELFKLSDLVKFAKYSPGIEENEEVIPTAVSFVNSTFMQTLEAEKEEK